MTRVDLAGASKAFSEDWLQKLIYARPEVLPIEQIEPGFGSILSVCRELPLSFGSGRSGALDNLFMTSNGGLVLVETKLWRNPEARRTVVAQAIEYASATFALNYEGLEQAVGRSRRSAGEEFVSLFQLVGSIDQEQDEASFVDAVTRNLNRGRAIVLVVGDGIREDILPLAHLLQTHAGQRFTFGLVELGVFASPTIGVTVVVPSVLAQTAMIERGVVQIEASNDLGSIVIREPTVVQRASSISRSRPLSITEDEFFEAIDSRDQGTAALVKAFLSRAEEIGIDAEIRRGLSLKHRMGEGSDLNLGTITRDGYLDTGPATWWDRTAVGRAYNERVAGLIGGFVKDIKHATESAVRTADGRTPRLTQLLPQHEGGWLDAMAAYIDSFNSKSTS